MKICLFLKGYLTPSPNLTRYRHWRVAQSHNKKAARALWFALHDVLFENSTLTTSEDLLRASLIASGMRALLPKIVVRRSTSKSAKPKSKPAKNAVRS